MEQAEYLSYFVKGKNCDGNKPRNIYLGNVAFRGLSMRNIYEFLSQIVHGHRNGDPAFCCLLKTPH